jgi:hypothetical protein
MARLTDFHRQQWGPAPLSPQAEAAAVELVPVASAEAPATKPSVEAPAGATKVPAGVTEVPPSPQERGSGDSPI